MTEGHRQVLTRELLLGYFEEAFTPRSEWQVGMEFEAMGVDAATGVRIPYNGSKASVRSCLQHYLESRGGDPVFEGENLIGIDGGWGAITLEPGGQVEWSSTPQADLGLLSEQLDGHLRALDAAADALEIRWLGEAMDPDTPLGEVPWMPKARYKILAPYLGARGRLAHRMMTQTASIQCAFDFEDPADWRRKFRVAALLAPVAVALFANSSRADGGETGYLAYREAIWRETDPDRCGLPPVVFDPGFGIEAWLEWVLDTPAIFLHRVRGLVPAGGVPFRNLLKQTGCKAVGMEDWELHLSAIFTEVRSYSYIEVRSADMQPAPTIMAVPSLYTGILYDPQCLGEVLEMCAGHDRHDSWSEAMDSAARKGLDGSAGGRSIRSLAERVLALAHDGLERNPAHAGDAATAVRSLVTLAERHGLDPGAAGSRT
jgi:glutamate--cysteine ligase